MNMTSEEQMLETIRDLKAALNIANNPVPSGCARGAWCKYCAWGKPFRAYRFGNSYDLTWECMKGSCESFVQRKETAPRK